MGAMSARPFDRLPEEPAALAALLAKEPARVAATLKRDRQRITLLQAKVEKLEAQNRLAMLKRYGVSSEQLSLQERLFDEAEVSADDEPDASEPPASDETVTVAAHRKRKPKRQPLPAALPRIVHEHTLDDPHCACGAELEEIGTETSEQLDVIPAVVYVVEHRRAKYVCRCCNTAPVTAPMPRQPIPRSLASPGFLAYVATSKYADGLPLNRQSKMFERIGVDIPRQTLAGQIVKAGELVTPLVNLMRDHITAHDIVQMDETPVQVLKEPGKVAQSQSYMWVMKGGPPKQPAILYRYEPSRSGQVPLDLLGEFAGYLQSDDYAGYNAVQRRPDVRGVGCWAHARRKFHDALKALPKAQQGRGNRIQQALNFIMKLYAIESRLKDASAEARLAARQAESRPVLETFKVWLERQSVPPQTLLGKAIHYTLGDWHRLTVYCEDGRLSIDNNAVENAIRPFAIGRKNWLFSDTPAGATASANLYGLVETAKANRLNEYAYLRYVFSMLPQAETVEAIEALLPWRVDPRAMQASLSVLDLESNQVVG
jgi:transposase